MKHNPFDIITDDKGLPRYVIDVSMPSGEILRSEPLGTWLAAHYIPPVNEARWTLAQLLEAEGWTPPSNRVSPDPIDPAALKP